MWQAFINEEILFFTALMCAIFFGCWALGRRAEAKAALRTFVAGNAIAAIVAAVLLAVPLYFQFFGAQAYHGLWPGARDYGGDLRGIPAFSSVTLAGSPQTAQWAQNPAEQNSYLGWPLIVLCVLMVAMMWRRTVVRAIVVCSLVALVLAPGGKIVFNNRVTHFHGPYGWLGRLPLFDSVIPTRWSLVLVPLIAVLLALWLDQMLALAAEAPHDRVQVLRGLTFVLVLVALVPLAPRRIHINAPVPIPVFFSCGEWRQYVPAGKTIVPVPLASNAFGEEPMRWAINQHLDFSMPGGYFLVPDPRSPDGSSMFARPAPADLGTVHQG